MNTRLYSPYFEDGETVLCSAIMTDRKGASYVGNMEVTEAQVTLIKALLDPGADINERRGNESGLSPLGTAAWLGKFGFVELLLDRGADPNYEPEPGDTTTQFVQGGRVPRLRAATVDRLEVAKHELRQLVERAN
ncbi:MAG: hypothetical protein HN345_05270 [Planctomycetaceae bacterium]|nr:hypothetical protein [Planctomycetaceae bacterium]